MAEIDVGQQMAQWAARLQSSSGGDKQGPLDGMILKTPIFTPTNVIPISGNIPALFANGTGSGMFGRTGPDKFLNAIQTMGDNFLKSLANTGIQPAPIEQASIQPTPIQQASIEAPPIGGARIG
jgi:hypothetical protein